MMMFERLMDRARTRAEQRARERVLKLAEEMRAELPRGIDAEAGSEGVRLIGRGLRRRFVLEPALRWMRLR